MTGRMTVKHEREEEEEEEEAAEGEASKKVALVTTVTTTNDILYRKLVSVRKRINPEKKQKAERAQHVKNAIATLEHKVKKGAASCIYTVYNTLDRELVAEILRKEHGLKVVPTPRNDNDGSDGLNEAILQIFLVGPPDQPE